MEGIERGSEEMLDFMLDQYYGGFYVPDWKKDQEMRAWLKSEMRKKRETFIVISNQLKNLISEEDLSAHLFNDRVPIYFGKIMYDFIHAQKRAYWRNKVKLAKRKNKKKDGPRILYGVVGSLTFHPKVQIKLKVWVLHTWAPDFESTQTSDYIECFAKKAGWKKMLAGKYREMWNLISSTASFLPAPRVVVHIPAIGTGAYLEALTQTQRKEALKVWYSTFTQAVQNLPEEVVFDLITFQSSRGRENNATKCPLSGILPPGSRLRGSPCGNDHRHGDLFDYKNWPGYPHLQKDRKTVHLMVNVWDPKSWIGNGGQYDNTAGMLVAGTSSGKHMLNSSYLHNPLLLPGTTKLITF